MIVGVLNGYYRSGTTIWMRIIAESNPSIAALSEPTSPIVVEQIRNIGFNGIEPLHGFQVFQGYKKLPEQVFEEYKKRWNEVFSKYKVTRGIMTSWDDVRYLLEPFDRTNIPVFIKSTQLHFFLKDIERYFNTKCLHLRRDIADCIAGHLAPHVLANREEAYRILMSAQRPAMFYLDWVYENLKEFFKMEYEHKNVLEKLIYNIKACNKFVANSKIRVVDFENFEGVKKAIIQHLRLHIHLYKLNLFDHSKVRIAPEWLRKLVNEVGRRIKV